MGAPFPAVELGWVPLSGARGTPIPMALCPVELLAPPCLQITPSNHAGIEPGRGAALVGSRKNFIQCFLLTTQHEDGEDRSSVAVYLQADASLGCTQKRASAHPFPSAGHTSVLGSWGALHHPDLRG